MPLFQFFLNKHRILPRKAQNSLLHLILANPALHNAHRVYLFTVTSGGFKEKGVDDKRSGTPCIRNRIANKQNKHVLRASGEKGTP